MEHLSGLYGKSETNSCNLPSNILNVEIYVGWNNLKIVSSKFIKPVLFSK